MNTSKLHEMEIMDIHKKLKTFIKDLYDKLTFNPNISESVNLIKDQ